MAVELRLGEIRAGQLQDLVGLAQFAHLALEILDALLLDRRGARPHAAVALALAHPLAQRLARAADLGRRSTRSPPTATGTGPWRRRPCARRARSPREKTSGTSSSWLHSQSKEPPRRPGRFTLACRHPSTTSAICTRPTVVTRASRRTLTLHIEERRARFVRLLFQSLHRDNLRPNQATLASRFRRRRTISVAGLLLDGKSSMTSGAPGAPTTARFPHGSRCSKAPQGKWPGTRPRPSKMPKTR
jgi:hypothetical protein